MLLLILTFDIFYFLQGKERQSRLSESLFFALLLNSRLHNIRIIALMTEDRVCEQTQLHVRQINQFTVSEYALYSR